jgi:hypothetical protein
MDVFTTNRVIDAVRNIRHPTWHRERDDRLPLSATDNANAGHADTGRGVQNDAEDTREKTHHRVIGGSVCFATLYGVRVALALRDRLTVGRGITTVVAPGHWGDGGCNSDGARRRESYDQRDERLVEHHRGD